MVEKILNRLSFICTWIASIILCLVTIMVIANVIGRILGKPLNGTMEVVQYGMLTAMCLVLCRTGFLKKHVHVTMFVDMMPTVPRAVIEFLQMFIAAATFGLIIILCFKFVPETIASGRKSDIFRFPFFLVYIVLAVGMFFASITFLYHAIVALLPIFGKGKKPEKLEEIEGP